MAKKRRAQTESCPKVVDESEDGAEMLSLLLDESDDEAPEEVTFEESKAEAERSLKEALDSVRREKEVLKEKRRRRQQLFLEQKKRRLLAADVLEEIDSSQKLKQSEDEAGEQQQEQQGKRSRKRKAAHALKLKGNYTVATLTEQTLASFQQQAAEDFIKSRLYGPGSRRTTNNELLSLQNKKGRNKSAAVQFVKKDWASKERAKAEKLKKRWLHKQQIDSC